MHFIRHILIASSLCLLLTMATMVPCAAFSTGVVGEFTIDPATVRQLATNESKVIATVTLQVPSPTYFVCQVRSSDHLKIDFANIVFKKGQIKGTAQGTVHWPRVMQDTRVKISAFNVDAPSNKLWVTMSLRVKDAEAGPVARLLP